MNGIVSYINFCLDNFQVISSDIGSSSLIKEIERLIVDVLVLRARFVACSPKMGHLRVEMTGNMLILIGKSRVVVESTVHSTTSI